MVQKSTKRPRGRPREYDPDTALVGATKSFWRAGFSGTSFDALSAATGMNKPSLYAAFGDKRDLYLAALDRYVERSRAEMTDALGEDLPIAAGLQRVYDRALDLYFADPSTPLGCFLIGTAATESAQDPDVREKLGAGLRELTRTFEARLRRAQAQGEIAAETDPAVLADMASAVLFSIALRARAGDDRAALRAFSREAVKLLCGGASDRDGPRPRRGGRSPGAGRPGR